MVDTAKDLGAKIRAAFVAGEHEKGSRYAEAYLEYDTEVSGLNFVIALIQAENGNFASAIEQIDLLAADDRYRNYYDVHLPLLLAYFHGMTGDTALARDLLNTVQVPDDFIYMDVQGHEITVAFVSASIREATDRA